jgi:hypothetical protein
LQISQIGSATGLATIRRSVSDSAATPGATVLGTAARHRCSAPLLGAVARPSTALHG